MLLLVTGPGSWRPLLPSGSSAHSVLWCSSLGPCRWSCLGIRGVLAFLFTTASSSTTPIALTHWVWTRACGHASVDGSFGLPSPGSISCLRGDLYERAAGTALSWV